MSVAAWVTLPPYARFAKELADQPLVEAFRLNTVMPIRKSRADTLRRLASFGKPLWVDLKGRQLRVVGAAIPPYTEVRVSHPVDVPVPVNCFFGDGLEHARVVAVDGDRLILEDGPRRLIGPGESVNIVHPELRVGGTLTSGDRGWLEAMAEVGQRRVMLSYVESPSDLAEVREHLPEAEILPKIETERGLAYAHRFGDSQGRLIAARGDLFVEIVRPHRLPTAVREVLLADRRAIVASRLFPSLASESVPSAQDIGDVAYLLEIGYRTFLLGDEVCLRRDSVLSALELLEAIAKDRSASSAAVSPRGTAHSAV